MKNFSASETLDEFGIEISDEIMKFGSDANKLINAKLQEANDYYLDLYNCYNNQISIEQRRELRVNIKCDFLKEYQHELKGVITLKNLKSIKGELKKLLRFDREHVSSYSTIKEIINRLAFNWKSVDDRRTIAIKKINQCFDELEAEFIRGIDDKMDKINNLYLMIQ